MVRRPAQGARGTTFVEIAISMLLLAIVTGSVFSVALSARHGGGKATRRLVANQAARQLSEQLKGYVTADHTDLKTFDSTDPDWLGFYGPAGAGLVGWSLDDATKGFDDTSCSGCYALNVGTHTITGLLPEWFSGPPYNATIKYVVKAQMTPTLLEGSLGYHATGSTIPLVEVYVDWDEP